MEKTRVLHVSQEVNPFLPKSEISTNARQIAQGIQEGGKEIRVFMPRFGCINERRHQLHEVIRLSGMNLIVDDTDHPLIIKVASIPTARMQVYFIDNEEYFKRKATTVDDEGVCFEDNDERSIFFIRGVLETVKKLGWKPDVIHCHGWMTSLMPLYLKKVYDKDPHFSDTKVVQSLYETSFNKNWDEAIYNKLKFDGFEEDDFKAIADDISFDNLNKLAIQYADGVVLHNNSKKDEFAEVIKSNDTPSVDFDLESDSVAVVDEFYDKLIEEQVLID